MIITEEKSCPRDGMPEASKYTVTTPDDQTIATCFPDLKLLSEACVLSENASPSTEQRAQHHHKTLREAVHDAASRIRCPFTTSAVLDEVVKTNCYDFTRSKTPKASVSSILSQDERYARVSHSTYTLASGHAPPSKKRKSTGNGAETVPKATKVTGVTKVMKITNVTKICHRPPLLRVGQMHERKHISEFKHHGQVRKNINFAKRDNMLPNMHPRVSPNAKAKPTSVRSVQLPYILPKPPQVSFDPFLYFVAHANAMNNLFMAAQQQSSFVMQHPRQELTDERVTNESDA